MARPEMIVAHGELDKIKKSIKGVICTISSHESDNLDLNALRELIEFYEFVSTLKNPNRHHQA